MKKIKLYFVASVFFLSLVGKINAQESNNNFRSIFNSKPSFGGYGMQHVGYTKMNGLSTIFFRIGGGISIDKRLGMGIAFTPFFTENPQQNNKTGTSYNGTYIAFFLEPTFFSEKPIHFSVPLLIGGGGISTKNSHYGKPYSYQWNKRWEDYLLFEPGINVEVNLARFLKIFAGFSYRMATELSLDKVENQTKVRTTIFKNGEFNGLSFLFGIKVGKF